eukprot:3156571-Pleurochrysis_carterae.AAC.1
MARGSSVASSTSSTKTERGPREAGSSASRRPCARSSGSCECARALSRPRLRPAPDLPPFLSPQLFFCA